MGTLLDVTSLKLFRRLKPSASDPIPSKKENEIIYKVEISPCEESKSQQW